jgi:hypothetical protein
MEVKFQTCFRGRQNVMLWFINIKIIRTIVVLVEWRFQSRFQGTLQFQETIKCEMEFQTIILNRPLLHPLQVLI